MSKDKQPICYVWDLPIKIKRLFALLGQCKGEKMLVTEWMIRKHNKPLRPHQEGIQKHFKGKPQAHGERDVPAK